MKSVIQGGKGTICKGSKRDFISATAVGGQEFMPRPVKVRAVKMQDPFTVHTLEGVSHGNAGDYLVQGTEGELYPCAADIFEKKYKAVEP